MTNTTGKVFGVNGNMVTVTFEGDVSLNEVGYIQVGDQKLKSEVIRVRGDRVEMQVFEQTGGIAVGDTVEFTGEMLAVTLGPG
ncbi:MAG: V-type ATP synthase subunit A, partial [Spirochaetota bacterium]